MDDRTYNAPQGGLRYYVAITQDELARLRAEVKRLESELTLRLRQLMRANAEDRLWLMKTERLTHDLADAQTVANLQRELHAAELATANDNAAELGKALDMCIAERDSAFAELDKHRRELTALRDERPRLLAANVRLFHDNNALRAELDAERNAHNATAAQLHAELADARAELDGQAKRHADVIERWKVEENTWHEFDKEQLSQIAALRAELLEA